MKISANGSPFGPWTLIADSATLKDSGSALQDPGYQPGIQAWYNQSLRVDPADPQHLLVGLEEVFESRDGGATWKTVGPYWNFGFPCWSIDPTKQTGDCPQTTHPDQHSASFGFYGGQAWEYVGNDGGIYRRPVDGATNADGHATDWVSLNDGTIDALQYYSVGVGTDPAGGGMAVSGGLQDNGQSILRANDKVMGSNFGGDGGDTLVDPNNGCNIVAEYVYLAMRVTNNCNANQGDGSPEQSTSRDIDPLDPSPRFIAPMSPDTKNINTWVAGGEFVYVQTHGFAIQTAAEWNPVFDLGAGHSATSISVSGGSRWPARAASIARSSNSPAARPMPTQSIATVVMRGWQARATSKSSRSGIGMRLRRRAIGNGAGYDGSQICSLCTRRISISSRWPSVTRRPVAAPFISIIVLSAVVVPCTRMSSWEQRSASGIPKRSASCVRPFITPVDWSSSVVGVLSRMISPAGVTQMRSVNVPPTSTPMR